MTHQIKLDTIKGDHVFTSVTLEPESAPELSQRRRQASRHRKSTRPCLAFRIHCRPPARRRPPRGAFTSRPARAPAPPRAAAARAARRARRRPRHPARRVGGGGNRGAGCGGDRARLQVGVRRRAVAFSRRRVRRNNGLGCAETTASGQGLRVGSLARARASCVAGAAGCRGPAARRPAPRGTPRGARALARGARAGKGARGSGWASARASLAKAVVAPPSPIPWRR